MWHPRRKAGAARRRRPRGFTLLELLVAIALLGLVLTLVYGAFGQIAGSALKLRDELTEQQEMRLLLRVVADDLGAAQWLQQWWDKGVGNPTGIVADTTFEDGKDFSDISFHAARPARFHREVAPEADPGLHEVGYFVRRDEDDGALELVRREDFYLDGELTGGGLTVVLADRIEVFLVEFLPPDARPGPTGEEPWQTRWDSPNRPENARMPGALRLTLARRDATGRLLTQQLELNLAGSLEL